MKTVVIIILTLTLCSCSTKNNDNNMGLFDKLFGKKQTENMSVNFDTTHLTKTAEMLDEDFKTKEGQYPQFEFTWQEENPESMKKICPKLFEKLWDR